MQSECLQLFYGSNSTMHQMGTHFALFRSVKEWSLNLADYSKLKFNGYSTVNIQQSHILCIFPTRHLLIYLLFYYSSNVQGIGKAKWNCRSNVKCAFTCTWSVCISSKFVQPFLFKWFAHQRHGDGPLSLRNEHESTQCKEHNYKAGCTQT